MATNLDVDLVWAALRSTRADPPAGVQGARHKTYVASLEQAQQMFTAGATVGVATRPLLLFYGLSQGGRAIAAAAKQGRNNDYLLSGHGIKVRPATLTGALSHVEVYTDGPAAGSFIRLSKILGSPVWDNTAPVALGELWNTLPEAQVLTLDHPNSARPLAAAVDDWHLIAESAAPVQVTVVGIPAGIADSQGEGPAPGVEAFLRRYPKLAGYTGMGPVLPGSQGGTLHLAYPSTHIDYNEREADALAHTTRYRMSDLYVFPAVGANKDCLHPFMAWWAVLFALSMLARYHPEAWADHIAVDSSKVAVAIEHLLNEALTAVPELLLRTIMDVSE